MEKFESKQKTLETLVNSKSNSIVINRNGRISRPAKLVPNITQNIDNLPFPAYDLVDWGRYSPSVHRAVGDYAIPIITARSCPFSCRYCHFHGTYRHHSIEYVENLMGYILEIAPKTDSLMIWDDTFTINPRRVAKLTEIFKKYELPYTINTRADTVSDEILTTS